MNLLDFIFILKNIKDILFATKNFNIKSLKIILEDNDVSIDIKERCYEKILKDYHLCFFVRFNNIDYIPEHIKRRAEEKCCEDPYWAYLLRKNIEGVSEHIKRRTEEKCLEDSQLAYLLRRNVKDLPEDIKRRAEEKACEDPYWGYCLRRNVKDPYLSC